MNQTLAQMVAPFIELLTLAKIMSSSVKWNNSFFLMELLQRLSEKQTCTAINAVCGTHVGCITRDELTGHGHAPSWCQSLHLSTFIYFSLLKGITPVSYPLFLTSSTFPNLLDHSNKSMQTGSCFFYQQQQQQHSLDSPFPARYGCIIPLSFLRIPRRNVVCTCCLQLLPSFSRKLLPLASIATTLLILLSSWLPMMSTVVNFWSY